LIDVKGNEWYYHLESDRAYPAVEGNTSDEEDKNVVTHAQHRRRCRVLGLESQSGNKSENLEGTEGRKGSGTTGGMVILLMLSETHTWADLTSTVLYVYFSPGQSDIYSRSIERKSNSSILYASA
jgi:hypothetical protein